MESTSPVELRQPTPDEIEAILGFYKDGYAPYGFIEDLQDIFHEALDGERNNKEHITLNTVNAFHALQCIQKMLHAFNPYRAD